MTATAFGARGATLRVPALAATMKFSPDHGVLMLLLLGK